MHTRSTTIVMEVEDFGFTKRNERILRKVLTVGGGSESKPRKSLLGIKDQQERNNSGAATDYTSREGTLSSALKGVAKGASTLPETGSGQADKRQSFAKAVSVATHRPNIPNVVEYHLKVKPKKGSENQVSLYT